MVGKSVLQRTPATTLFAQIRTRLAQESSPWIAAVAALGRHSDVKKLPSIGGDIVTQDVEIALRVLHLEVAVIGRQPAVDNFGNLDLALPEPGVSSPR